MNNEENIVIYGKVERIVFEGDNGYKIISVLFDDTLESETIVGYMNVIVSQRYEFSGEYVLHKKFGEQFQVNSYKLITKDGEDAVVDLLSSNQFDGIGKRTARKIYKEFGDETVEVLKNDPQKVIDLGIREELVTELNTKLLQLDGINDVYKILNNFSLSEYYVNEIYGYLNKNNIVNKVEYLQRNTFDFLDVIIGIPFLKLDEIYQYYNENSDDKYRYNAIYKFYFKEMCYKTGNTIINKDELINYISKKIIVNKETLKQVLEISIEENMTVEINDNEIMLNEFYNTEQAIARNVKLRQDFASSPLEKDNIINNILALEKKEGINYSEVQKEAIINALSNNISIITGGPGTGKTTIIKAIVKSYEMIKCKNMNTEQIRNEIILCAPTGRAAKRMNETSGFDAKTIHSLLEWDPYQNKFNKGLDEQLPHKLIIVDEFSMVDIFLTRSLLMAIRPDAIIVVVGDSAQLESVNPGNVLGDLVDSNFVSTIKLDQVFRQGDGSTIATLAKTIENDDKIELVNTHDMGVIQKNSNIAQIVKKIVDKSYTSGYSDLETQVLYPKYSGKSGIDELNKILKPEINEEYYEYGDITYQVGDKVMQLKNDYEKEIYNGDIGHVKKILNKNAKGNNNAIIVSFKDKEVSLTRLDLINLTHAYAISIHKSQGSEFKVVVFPVTNESIHMLSKKLIYTAITRAKDKLVIIGDMDAFYKGVKENNIERKTYLKTLLS